MDLALLTGAPPGKDVDCSPRLAMTKLQCPPLQSRQVLREQLLAAMRASEGSFKLILVQAPAGYGKSVLLRQYLARRQAEGIPTLWLTLDSADNDLDRLVRHLDAGWLALDPQRCGHVPSSQGLLERLSGFSEPFSLFLDEFDALHNPFVLRYVQQLIEYLPACGQIVIGSRHVPDVGVGRLRARNQLLELSQGDLRFSLAETGDLLVQHHALSLKGRDVKVLHERTEGWVAAIHLAALALPDYGDAGSFLATFSGSHAELAQYLAEDILRRLTDGHRNFLLETSVLSELNVSLCNWVTRREDGAAQLHFLAHNNLFLTPLDSEHKRYRYHGLLAGYLLDRLKATQPARCIELHRRAAEWFLREGQPLMAIDHQLHDTDQRAAIALLDRHAASLLAEGRVRRLLRWFGMLSPALLRQHPPLLLIFGWALTLNRRHREAQFILDRFLSEPAANVPADLARQARTLQCLQLSMTDQIAACHEASEQQLTSVAPEQTLQYGVLITIVAYCMIAAGQYEPARQIMARALHQDFGLHATFIRSLCDALEGWIDLIQGRLGHAAPRLERSYERACSAGERGMPGGKAVIGIPYAEVLYERNELARAQHMLGECLSYARENGTVDTLISAYLLLSRISHISGDRDSACRYLKELEDAGLETGLTRAIAAAQLEAARALWLDGDLEGAQTALRRFDEMNVWTGSLVYAWPAHDVESGDVMRWRLMIAQGDGERAVVELKSAFRTAHATQRHRRALKIRVLLSSALMACGKSNPAMQTLTEALQVASKEGFVRVFLDEGNSVEHLLALWARRHRDHADRLDVPDAFCEKLFGARGRTMPASSDTAVVQSLTKRELQVLHYLADGARTRVIADSLFVSEVTVKAHLRNISTKLGAHGRIEAVAIARRQGLLL